MKKERLFMFATFSILITALILYFTIGDHAVTLFLIVIIILCVLSVLCVYRNLFTKYLEAKYYLVGTFVVGIFLCDVGLLIKRDVVDATLCATFLNGNVFSREVEEDGDEGTYWDTKQYFEPSTPQDKEMIKYVEDIPVFLMQVTFLISLFAWYQIDYKPKEYEYGKYYR